MWCWPWASQLDVSGHYWEVSLVNICNLVKSSILFLIKWRLRYRTNCTHFSFSEQHRVLFTWHLWFWGFVEDNSHGIYNAPTRILKKFVESARFCCCYFRVYYSKKFSFSIQFQSMFSWNSYHKSIFNIIAFKRYLEYDQISILTWKILKDISSFL